MTTITVCISCRQPDLREAKIGAPCGEAMIAHVEAAAAGTDVKVRGVSCLLGCEHGCNVAVSDTGKMAYVIGSFEPGAEAAEALVEYAQKHATNELGVVPYREWPQGVKGHFKARIPPVE